MNQLAINGPKSTATTSEVCAKSPVLLILKLVVRLQSLCLPWVPRQGPRPQRRSMASRRRQFRRKRPRYPSCRLYIDHKGRLINGRWSLVLRGERIERRGIRKLSAKVAKQKSHIELRHFDWSHWSACKSREKSHDVELHVKQM